MAARRLFTVRAPLCHSHLLPIPTIFWGFRVQAQQWQQQCRGLAAATIVRNRRKKEKDASARATTAAVAAAAPSHEHLTRRTRSAAAFDRSLYRRYADKDEGHVPVLLGEVLDVFGSLQLRSFVDCTLGAGGHSAAIIEAHRELELYIGLDMDPLAHDRAKMRIEAILATDDDRCRSLAAYTHVRNFKYIKSVLSGVDENLIEIGVDGILMDLGVSSMQVDSAERGFSVLSDGPLDMRMNPQASLTAEDILNTWPESEVGKIFRDYGEETNWHFLQKQIVKARVNGGLHSTKDLLDLVRKASPRSGGRQGWIKTATRVFQALRIAVNDELQTLQDALYAAFDCLSAGGRLVVISFHSLEDRIVKQTFLDIIGEDTDRKNENLEGPNKDGIDMEGETWSKHRVRGKHGTVLTKRPITPSNEEEKLNRRCRSAKLRVIQKN